MPKKRKKKKIWLNEEVDSDLELLFLVEWRKIYPNDIPLTQHRFHPTRKFRFDFCWPAKKYAVEVQGYGPGHNSLVGMTQDYDKNIAALLENWKIIYITSIHLQPARLDTTIDSIASILRLPPRKPGYVPLKFR